MIVNSVHWRVVSMLSPLLLATAACAGNPAISSEPTPSVYFVQQQSASIDEAKDGTSEQVSKEIALTAEVIGQLVLINGCLRLNTIDSDTSYLLVWPPEFSWRTENTKAQILDGDGQVVAHLGEEVYVSGGEVGSIDLLTESLRQQLPPGCPGPFWMVGLEVRPNIRPFSNLVNVNVIETVDRAFFFIRQKAGIDEWAVKEAPLKGELALFDRCLRIIPDDQATNYTPIWPTDYQVRLRNGDIEIVNGFDQVVTRVGGAVYLDGGKIPVMWDLEGYRKLRDDLPGECQGPYWIVKE